MKQCFTRHRPSSNKKRQTPRSWETHETPAYWLKRLSRLQCREGESWKRQPAPWVEWTELKVQGSHRNYSLEGKVFREEELHREKTLKISRVPPWVFSCIWNSILIWGNTQGSLLYKHSCKCSPEKTLPGPLLARQKWDSQELSPNK